jgi:hypothetical protein
VPYGRHAGGDAEVVLKRSAARSAAEPPLGDAKGRLGRLISRSECGAPGGVRARANNKAERTRGLPWLSSRQPTIETARWTRPARRLRPKVTPRPGPLGGQSQTGPLATGFLS